MEEKKYYTHKINNLIVIKRIVTIHYQELPKEYIFKGEKHDFWEIAYVDKNSIEYSIDGKTVIVNQGEIIFIKPNAYHSLKCKEESNLLIVSFECRSSCMKFFIDKHFSVRKDRIDLLSNIINEAKNTFVVPKFKPDLRKLELLENPNLGGEQLIKNYLEIFLIKQLRHEAAKPTSGIEFYSKVNDSLDINDVIIKTLKDNLYNHIYLDDICIKTGYGKTFLCTKFKQTFKNSIISYYLNLKIEEAKSLIIRKFSFSQISDLLKFDSLSHFTHTFKKYTNMTPKQYKQSVLNFNN